MLYITNLNARWILDSRGFPTVQADITLHDHDKHSAQATASVPSGASTGTHEAVELRDKDTHFHGKGVNQAVQNILEVISQNLYGREFTSARDVDSFVLSLDHSANKSELGANAILAVSMAAHRAAAQLAGLELWEYLQQLYFEKLPRVHRFPRLMCNVINGGEHTDTSLDLQEFMIVPDQDDLQADIKLISETYHTLKKSLKKDGKSTGLGDEGGFAPELENSQQALTYLQEAIHDSGYATNTYGLAVDCAANEFFNSSQNIYELEKQTFTQAQLADYYKSLSDTYNLISIEDPFAEDDLLGWQIVTKLLNNRTQLVGDDLFVTNPNRFQRLGIDKQIANSILIKPNQIGSIKETCEVIHKAKNNHYTSIVSHRSGETIDSFIADLAFASQSEFLKLGAPARGERVAKFNRLLEIYDQL